MDVADKTRKVVEYVVGRSVDARCGLGRGGRQRLVGRASVDGGPGELVCGLNLGIALSGIGITHKVDFAITCDDRFKTRRNKSNLPVLVPKVMTREPDCSGSTIASEVGVLEATKVAEATGFEATGV